jgi:CheY-like chemotaxis protein
VASKTLLLADDSVTIQRVVELTFAHEDVRVVAVADGKRALEFISVERPDIVVADVGVAEIDGYAIATHIRKSAVLRDTPVLLLAGAFEPVDEGKVRNCGCDGVLVKPFEPQQLVGRVKELLTERRSKPGKGKDKDKEKDKDRDRSAGSGPVIVASRPEIRPEPVGFAEVAVAAAAPASVLRLDTPSGAAPTAVSHMSQEPVERLVFDHAAMTTPSTNGAAAPEALEPPASPIWEFGIGQRSSAPSAPAPAPAPAKVSLANAFSALLAAEQSRPAAAVVAAPEIPVEAIEEAVRRILDRMTGETVRQVVLEAAERLIREEIEKIKANPE